MIRTSEHTIVVDVKRAIALLADRSTPQELHEYKQLLYACCDRIARAAGNSLRDKQRISSQEKAVLDQIRTALGH